MKQLLISSINFYQKNISPFSEKRCIYIPTCSEYAKEAIKEYGAIKGSIKGMSRILRCNHFSKGGFDPVKKNS